MVLRSSCPRPCAPRSAHGLICAMSTWSSSRDAIPQSSTVLRDASQAYRRGAETAHGLDGGSLSIAAGEFVAIVGPSGCGKSTLLRLICGLIPASGGEIVIADRRVPQPDGGVGIVFQAPILLDWRTVLGNLLFPVEMQGKPVADYLPEP